MAGARGTKIPKWVFWLTPIVMATVVVLAFALAPADLGNYRVGDVYGTAAPVQVVTLAHERYRHFAVCKLGALYPYSVGEELLEYTLSPGTQIRVTEVRSTRNAMRDGGLTPPEVMAEIVNGPHAGARLDLGGVSVVRDPGYFAKVDPSSAYLSLITQGSGR
jgi:hypothetical protein